MLHISNTYSQARINKKLFDRLTFCWFAPGDMIYDMIYLTSNGLPTGGSSTVHIYTQTIHRTTKNKQYIEQNKNSGRVRGRAPPLRVILWHLPYIWGKKHGKTSVRVAEQ
jgi:hypothetical protein